MKKILISLLTILLITGCSNSNENNRTELIQTTLGHISAGEYDLAYENLTDKEKSLTSVLTNTKEIKEICNPEIFVDYPVTNEILENINTVYSMYTDYVVQHFEIVDSNSKNGYHRTKVFVQYLDADLINSNLQEVVAHIESIKENEDALTAYLDELDFRYEEAFLNGSKQDYLYVYINKDNPNKISYILTESENIPE